MDSIEYFYSLCKPPEDTKKVKCLSCKKVFIGSKSKRICSACKNTHKFNRVSESRKYLINVK